MGANSKIEWTDHTFSAWVGCTKISAACDHCYAESWAKRTGQAHLWSGERRRTTEANWRQPRKWNRDAAAAGVRRKVFCASLADVFDNQVPDEWRIDLWALIAATPHLDWLLLTKRPQNILKMCPQNGDVANAIRCKIGIQNWPWPNVWLGTTVENQEERRRIDYLRKIPAAVRFLSCEPLLEDLGEVDLTDIHWVIAGGESGSGARAMHPDWCRSLWDQCAAAGVAYFHKQNGEWLHESQVDPTRRQDFEFEGRADRGFVRLGKKLSGRLLDGVEHNEMP